ncbi:MAG TPA: patatin-like phospholipase family protein [Lacunisphaera sp.]|nr:patatin-like phospholipase family protein [Lacunisphaera sp.]
MLPLHTAGIVVLGASLAALGLTGCAHAPLNRMLTEEAAPRQVRIMPRPAGSPGDGTAIALFFSGGGTRAAAFSYGVLKELAQTPLPGPPPGRLLDDVEVIGAVSGGSFTAAYYCLYHDRIFEDFESRFLKRNVERGLAMRAANPCAWPRLMSPYFGRSDLAAEYYDWLLFKGATFGDLAKGGGRPYLAINATDMATGQHFVFSHPRFGLIGSSINDFPIARAVAASSAVPLVLTPMTIKNYSGLPGAAQPRFVPREPGEPGEDSPRDVEVLRLLHSYADSTNRPYIHLVDGGLADNLGMQSLIDDIIAVGGADRLMELGGLQRTKRLVVIVVNSAASRGEEWNRREAVPGMLTSILALGDRSGARANHQTMEAFRHALDAWKKHARDPGRTPGDSRDYYFIHVNFDALVDPSDRSYFRSLLTTFALPDSTVDRLIAAGGKILRDSPEFKRLLADLNTNP